MLKGRDKIRKLLVANRGEIAVRIIRACREMGIKTVAIYSDIDSSAMHVRLADEVRHIGPSPSNQSYLVIDRIIQAALDTNSDALHPGYGFLSENHALARACLNNDIRFVGPPPEVIMAMGEKTVAKRTMEKVGIPILAGMDKPIDSLAEAREIAHKFRYPVILKASMGGGGRGMRIARSDYELENAFRGAQSEALAAFGSDDVFIEKYMEKPRHVEFQVLADMHGNVIHLGERDCTLQRRHQKLLEEAPSPFIDDKLRKDMGDTAIKASKAAGYVSAGTIEFLLDENKNFYFMEMNTRIQVEHPVTEMVTGVDIIKEQIKIASGEELSLEQKDVKINGWAIECRINAEDSFKDFIPCPGRIESIRFPLGPGIRIDTAVFDGYEIPRQYDSLIAKVIAHAPDRKSAITRMEHALSEMKIKGIKSTKEFHLALMRDRLFKKSQYDTSFIEKNMENLKEDLNFNSRIAAIAAAVDVFIYTQRLIAKRDEPNGALELESKKNWKMSTRFKTKRKYEK